MSDIPTVQRPRDRDPDDLGGLWEKESRHGLAFMSGTIAGVEVVCWRNDRKPAGSNQPDWRVKKAKPRPEGGRPAGGGNGFRHSSAPGLEPRADEPVNTDDIPF